MSIQFRCQGCSQSLKVPDGSSGKKVRCPECETVNIIPEATAQSGEVVVPSARQTPSTDSENPFAAPQSTIEPQQQYVRGELTRQTIELGEVLDQSWQRFSPTIGMSALFGLVLGGVGIASGIIGQSGQLAARFLGDPLVAIPVMIIGIAGQQFLNTFQQTMGKRYGLNVVRGETEVMSGVFSFAKVIQVFLFFILIGVLSMATFAIVAIPVGVGFAIDGGGGGPAAMAGGIIAIVLAGAALFAALFIAMRICLTVFFIVDRDASITEAMSLSYAFMAGNCVTTFFTMFVTVIGVFLVGVFTCGLGFLVALPFLEVVQAMIYSKVTGQYQNFQPNAK